MKPQHHQQQQRQRRRTADPILTLQVPPSNRINRTSRNDIDEDEDEQHQDELIGNRSSISSVCFVSSPPDQHRQPTLENEADDDDDDNHSDSCCSSSSSDDDDEQLNFRCRRLGNTTIGHSCASNSIATSLLLSGTILASCHTNGDAFLWDLGQRRIVSTFYNSTDRPRGAGITIRRLGDGMNQQQQQQPLVLYQTRDPEGTVSIHHMESSHPTTTTNTATTPPLPVITSFSTRSRTFCAAAPCWGDAHLVVVPTDHPSYAAVRDIRCSPTSSPAIGPFFAAKNHKNDNDNATIPDKHGVITSMAMATTSTTRATISQGSPRLVVACGMESGHVFFHDMAMPQHPLPSSSSSPPPNQNDEDDNNSSSFQCISGHIQLSRDPILALDLAPSINSRADTAVDTRISHGNEHKLLDHHHNQHHHSVVAVAGMAGDAADLSEQPKDQQGTVALLKTTFHGSNDDDENDGSDSFMDPTIRIRSRWNTCDIQDPMKRGKPGVAVCRFRPDDHGRIIAVGGWDYRVRLYDRRAATTHSSLSSSSQELAIYKGHSASVTAIDWAPRGGLLATGAGDGRICIWDCFASSPSSSSR